MDPRLKEQYDRELRHLREVGGEFSHEFPKIASRLALDAFECADPYVERLLEGFAFLAARVQVEIKAQFPQFTRHLLEMVYPHCLAPTPSMAIVQFEPDSSEGGLADGFEIPRGCVLRSRVAKDEQTACIYRTAHPVTLWPLQLIEAEYLNRETSPIKLPEVPEVRAVLRLRLQTTAGLKFQELSLDRLPIYLRSDGRLAMQLYEQLLSDARAVVVRRVGDLPQRDRVLSASSIANLGFDDEQALLTYGPKSFQGYRLLHEYFAMPQRFMFVEFSGLRESLEACSEDELEILVLLGKVNAGLENVVKRDNFELFCAPAANLFDKRADRIHVSDRAAEYHVLPDRTRPMDFEVYDVTQLTGFGATPDGEQEFHRFFALLEDRGEKQAYYTLRREPRLLSTRQRREGARSSYIGSEVYVTLVDEHQAPYRSDLRQLGPRTLCTNRDLPLHMPVGGEHGDFTLDISAPIRVVRCVAGPTSPRPSLAYAEGETAWRLVNHLSLNYLSLSDNDPQRGAAALRELLRLYANDRDSAVRRQIDGVRSISALPQTRRLPVPGPIVFGRALEIIVTLDESSFEGTGVFLLGAVLDQFFAKYVSFNSMTETVISSTDRGEVHRWPVRTGKRHTV